MLWGSRGDENEPDLGMSPLLSFFHKSLSDKGLGPAGQPRAT